MPEHAVAATSPLMTEAHHASRRSDPWSSSSPALPLLVFAVLAAAIAAMGAIVFAQYRQDMQQAVQENLFGIADAKVHRFLAWRDERRGDASALMNDASFRAEYERWARDGMPHDWRRKRLLQRLVALRDAYGYEDVLLYDRTPALVLSANPDAMPATSFGMNLISEVLRTGRIEHSDIHYLRQDGREYVRLGTLAPISPPGADAGPPNGVVLLRHDPTKELFPSIQAWPMPTKSGETFLAKREADTIIYLTELQHRKAQGVATRLSVTDEKLLAAQTARGQEGFLDGVDYRGMAVIGAARLIPGTSWLIVSKIDKEEIYAPIRRTGWIVGIVTLLFVAATGVITAIWWRGQRNALLAGVYQARLLHEATKRRLDNVSKYANDIILLSDEQSRIVEANDRALEAYGYSIEELRGMHASALRDPESAARFEEDVKSWGDKGRVYETVQRRRDGTSFPVEVSGCFVDIDGRRYQQAIIRDISERKRAEAAISSGEAQLRLYANVYEHSGEGILISDRDNRILAVNPAFTRLTGYGIDELRGNDPRLLASGITPIETYRDMWTALGQTGYWQGEIWNKRKDGKIFPEWLSVSVVRDLDGQLTHYIACFTDISERKASEEHISRLAHHDTLTGLLNRLSLQNRLEQALATAKREHGALAVMFIDMDHFKNINDILGHAVGDALLAEVACRLRESVRDSDVVARLGGDEFVLVLTEVDNATAAARVADKILRTLGQPYSIGKEDLYITPSIGLAFHPGDGDDCETLLKHADTAMYHAKSQGRNNVQFFTAAMNQAAVERLELDHDLRVALEEGQFELHYQPQVDARTACVVGVEALVRWRHPRNGLVSPLTFIPLAEETGSIIPLGEWVLNEACRQLRIWRQEGLQELTMAVNLSAHQLRSPTLLAYVSRTLERHELAGADLELEVTESVAMANPEASIGQLQALRDLGVRLSIDDFGTGYSSLSYLKRLPIHSLKLDQSFVREIETDANDVAICTATIALAHNLGLKVVAEGVENRAQSDFLAALDCDTLQGYLYSKPVPAHAARVFFGENAMNRTMSGGDRASVL